MYALCCETRCSPILWIWKCRWFDPCGLCKCGHQRNWVLRNPSFVLLGSEIAMRLIVNALNNWWSIGSGMEKLEPSMRCCRFRKVLLLLCSSFPIPFYLVVWVLFVEFDWARLPFVPPVFANIKIKRIGGYLTDWFFAWVLLGRHVLPLDVRLRLLWNLSSDYSSTYQRNDDVTYFIHFFPFLFFSRIADSLYSTQPNRWFFHFEKVFSAHWTKPRILGNDGDNEPYPCETTLSALAFD